METINIDQIIVEDRIRSKKGDINALAESITETKGLIEPLILNRSNCDGIFIFKLLAGGRRIAALKKLGRDTLVHGIDYIYRDEIDPLLAKIIELEENLKRENLTWQEEVLGKQQLLKLMQERHGGPATQRGSTREEIRGDVKREGFGIRSLAAMLGESPGTTHRDLEIAKIITKIPTLGNAKTKESALRQTKTGVMMLGMLNLAKKKAAIAQSEGVKEKRWTLYEGDLRDHSSKIPDNSVDLVYTDLPFGVNLDSMSKHANRVVQYKDSVENILDIVPLIADETARVLCQDRFAIFYFGFNYYSYLLDHLQRAGLSINPVPIVWYKHTRSTENPNTHYANAYDAAIVAWKGRPMFIRPGQTNVIDIPALAANEKIQIAQQPVPLVQRFLGDMTIPNSTVLDWCAGSGTTGEACLKSNRKVILFEREPQACQIIKVRLSSI